MRTRPTPLLTALTLGAATVLVGCSAGGTPDAPPPATSDGTAGTTPSASADAPPEADGGAAPASCDAVPLTPGEQVASADLATCYLDHMYAAGAGAYAMHSDTVSSTTVWRLGDVFEAYAELDSGNRMLATADGVWVDLGGTGWVSPSPDDPELQVEYLLVEQWRATGGPEYGRDMLASAPGWVVGERGSVDLPDGSAQDLHPVQATGGFTWGGLQVESMTLWVDGSARLVLQDTTSSGAGITAAAQVHYTQWGGTVELPDATAS